MLQVDNLIEPRAEQNLLSGLPPFRWPHPNLPPKYAPEQRITTADSTEFLISFCKRIDPVTANSRNINRRNYQDYPVASGNSGFFTDDSLGAPDRLVQIPGLP